MRNYANFLQGYLDYTQHMEAPTEFHLWTALSCISGALRGKAYIDMKYFKWKPNQFIIFVAPPGVVSKSTTSGVGMKLLRKVPGINFGPSSVTWQALTENFVESIETFRIEGKDSQMANLTLEASELGTLLDFNDTKMIDVFVDLWDGKDTPWERRTKGGGKESIPSPWINLIGCTTPSWVLQNMPSYAIGGGFASRCVFVYADTKEKCVAYPADYVPPDHNLKQKRLVEDLTAISQLSGEFTIEPDAKEWGTQWYEEFHRNRPDHLKDDRFGGYVARKQTHLHKVAMCLSAAESDSMVITMDHFQTAIGLLGITEENMGKVFDAMGDNNDAKNLKTLREFIIANGGRPFTKPELYSKLCARMSLSGFEESLNAGIMIGWLKQITGGDGRVVLSPDMNKIKEERYRASAEEKGTVDRIRQKDSSTAR